MRQKIPALAADVRAVHFHQQWNDPYAVAVEIRKSSMVFPAESNSRTQCG
jgi:hypothetical protein